MTQIGPRLFTAVCIDSSYASTIAKLLDSQPEILCLHTDNALSLQDRVATVGAQLQLMKELGTSYLSAGTAGYVPRREIVEAKHTLGKDYSSALVVQHPMKSMVWLLGAKDQHQPNAVEGDLDEVRASLKNQGIQLSDDSAAIGRILFAASLFNSTCEFASLGKVFRLEDVVEKPKTLAALIGGVSGGSIEPSTRWLKRSIGAIASEARAGSWQKQVKSLDEREKQLFYRLVHPKVWDFYSRLGYEIPTGVGGSASRQSAPRKRTADHAGGNNRSRSKPARDNPPREGARIFEQFASFRGVVLPGFSHDFIGVVTRSEFAGWAADDQSVVVVETSPPPVNEEYFEWIEVLQSVIEAESKYVMIELGAGFGRWTARAALAARQRGIPRFRGVLVEAEPQHAVWARLHMQDNDLAECEYEVVEAAVGGTRGLAHFPVEHPGLGLENAARDWYGQALLGKGQDEADQPIGKYLGHDVFKQDNGYHVIQVQVETLSSLLKDLECVDLIDMDIQGSEADVIEESIDTLDSKVIRVMIGTHNPDAEKRLRQVFTRRGWEAVWDYPGGQSSDTPYGRIEFQDGVQVWLNHRLRTSAKR